MAKSQESYNKKEKEKKRIQKKLKKSKGKEERKAVKEKPKSFDEMIAYVDAMGNITSTPPDPHEISEIKSEDIQIGIQKQIDPDPSDLIRKGKLTFYNESKAYGFIKDDQTQESIFAHLSGFEEPVNENDKVTFETQKGKRGLVAVKVRRLI